jgi:hypothetical protein
VTSKVISGSTPLRIRKKDGSRRGAHSIGSGCFQQTPELLPQVPSPPGSPPSVVVGAPSRAAPQISSASSPEILPRAADGAPSSCCPPDLLPRAPKTPQVFVGHCPCVVDVILPTALCVAPPCRSAAHCGSSSASFPHRRPRPMYHPTAMRRQVGREAAFGRRRENS